ILCASLCVFILLPPTETCILSLRDALPIHPEQLTERAAGCLPDQPASHPRSRQEGGGHPQGRRCESGQVRRAPDSHRRPCGCPRSEEHTSELQTRFDLVCRHLLDKKNINKN